MNPHLLAATTVALLIGVSACSKAPRESRAERAAAEEALAASPTPTPPTVSSSAVTPAAAPSPPVASQAFTEADLRETVEKLYKGMDPGIPEPERRKAAEVMAEDLRRIAHDMREDEVRNGAESQRLHQQAERDRSEILRRDCEQMRSSLAHLEKIQREGLPPGEHATEADLKTIPGDIAEIRGRLTHCS